MKIKREIKVALFGIFVLFITYWGISFLKGFDLFTSAYTYKIQYEKSENIEVSSPVLIRGVKVGSVTAVNLMNVDKNIEVIINVRKKFPIPENSVALLTNKSMLGGKAINIQVGNSTVFLKDDDFIKGEIDNNVSEQIDELKGKITGVMDELTVTLASINKVLNPQTIENLNSTMGNFSSISSDAAKSMNELSSKLTVITSNLESITGDLKETTPALKDVIVNFGVISDSLKISLPELVSSINKTVSEVDKTVELLNNGEGTLGMLLNDKLLYNNLNTTTKNLSSLLLDVKEHPSRYVQLSMFGRRSPQQKEQDRQEKQAIKEKKKLN